jgi:hypothetical protein
MDRIAEELGSKLWYEPCESLAFKAFKHKFVHHDKLGQRRKL